MNTAPDSVERRAKELGERALFHVAGTRAVRGLYVTWNGQASAFIDGSLLAKQTIEPE